MLPQYPTTAAETTESNLSIFDRAKQRVLGKTNASQRKIPDNSRVRPGSQERKNGLLEKFSAMTGPAKTAFFRANKPQLKAAAAAEILEASHTREVVTTGKGGDRKNAGFLHPGTQETAEALLEKFSAMIGPGKTAFFRANKALLKAAAATVEIREAAIKRQVTANDAGNRAVRNFVVAQSEALPWVSGEKLLERFHSLSGTAKTVYLRANHLALKIAAANENH